MKKSIGIILIIGIVLTLALLIGILPSVSDYQAKHRIYTDMQTDLSDVMNANIRIVSVDKHDGGIAYGAGSSGVVIEKTDNKYYALTAFHVLANDEIDYFVVITPDDPSVFDYKKEHEGVGQEEYYNQLPKVKVEFEKEESDLAVISFESDKQISVVQIAETMPEKGDRIAVISNPEGEKFVSTYGKIKSSKPENFSFNDDQSDNLVVKHSAYEAPGSSGSAVYNESMELVGINIGGGRDVFGRFRYGVMIPTDQINECISRWQEEK